MRQLFSYKNTGNNQILHWTLNEVRLAYMRAQCYNNVLKIFYIIKEVSVKMLFSELLSHIVW